MILTIDFTMILAIDDELKKVMLTMCTSQPCMLHIRIMTSVIRHLSSIVV